MTRREQLEKKVERRREWADKAQARSESKLGAVHRLADGIPLGQPILVGHHSEKHARRDAERIQSGMAAGVAEGRLAEHHTSKTDGLERQLYNTIFSDDENVIDALEKRIEKNEKLAERYKSAKAEKWMITNTRARIRADKKRIEEIRVRMYKTKKAEAAGGVLVEIFQDYAVVTFAKKPEWDTIKELKDAQFFRVGGHWQGRAENLPERYKK